MAIEELTAIVSVPSTTYETGNVKEWNDVESELGSNLPSDYKAFVSNYGTGNLADFVHVYTPFAAIKTVRLIDCVQKVCESNRHLKEQSHNTDMVPFPIYPDRPGLLPWGWNDVGQFMYWLTEGQPDDWPVVLGASRSPAHERFEFGMTTFLAKALTRTLDSKIWPDDFPEPNVELAFYPAMPKNRRSKQ